MLHHFAAPLANDNHSFPSCAKFVLGYNGGLKTFCSYLLHLSLASVEIISHKHYDS